MDSSFGWVCHVGTGVGALVAPDRVLTARHVVRDGSRAKVRFPAHDVSAEGDVRLAPPDDVDLAVIDLDQPVDIGPAPVRPSTRTAGHHVLVPGNLTDSDELIRTALARVVGDAGDGSWQLDVDPGKGYAIVPGHSGAPVIDADLGSVIGICRARETKADLKVGRFLGVENAARLFEDLQPWLGWRLSEQRASTSGRDKFGSLDDRLVQARQAHWYPRARGLTTEVSRASPSLFCGRSVVLAKIDDWIAEAAPGVLFVTGDPGAGKSAVVAHVVERADPLAGSQPGYQFRYAFHAKDRSAGDLTRALSDALGGPHDAETETALSLTREHRPLVAIDGLDEAASGEAARIVDLASSIAGAGGLVLVGARRSVLPRRPSPGPLDLDDPTFFAHKDLVEYCCAVLQRRDRPEEDNPWRLAEHESATLAHAESIARAAGRNFLVAGLMALSRSLLDPHVPPLDDATEKPDLGRELERLLDAIDLQLDWRPL